MKYIRVNKILSFCAIAALALSTSSCKKFLDVNDTPNNPLAIPPNVALPGAIVGSAFANNNELNRFGSVLIDVTSGAAGSPLRWDRYNTDGDDFGNQWRFEIYDGALVNYKKIIESEGKYQSPVYSGISKIMMAYTFGMTTDCWGDIPYSDALKGNGATQPKLDTQKDIYLGAAGIQSLFDLVKDGMKDLDKKGLLIPKTDDVVYGGDIVKWKKAGNTLLLKLALQISLVEPAKAKAIIDEVLASADSYIKSNSENLEVKFGASVGSRSPVYEYTRISSFRTDQLISTRFLTKLQSTNDPRLTAFITKPGANYVTVDNGFAGTVPGFDTRSQFGNYVTGINGEGPVRLVSNWQRAFILAEAVLRLGTAGDAQALYTEGITASMQSAGVSGTDITAFLTANPTIATLSGTNEAKIKQIIDQKYISLVGNGFEQWTDWRRTGYPDLPAHQNAVGIDGTRPVRLQYITQEIQRNPNFKTGILPNVKVWWDVN
ncbi:SusD/RagB family nutrient-binding outer membrane lipoprotein [Pedobacter sp. KBW06]|uniref:SusD/RagB family nutrient-binding outer membrane lipoprotein n=1 Tax=Pedobacter sp. KBW06 TaxID=2153359 RepID=UPI000F5A0D47|nr:SusD/RagB family nutrient-binding outer membrane lipoprotein [Pedobacter sp. KBW06]RQO68017.1 SusD/RagB family nutrient-binding outer membrane lipoprotein [Pedobacter sp. KBW06]